MTDIVQKNEEQGPPDLEDIFKKFTKGKKRKNDGNTSDPSGGDVSMKNIWPFFLLILLVLAIIWALSGIFIVKPAERTALLRFGKYTRTVGPGPHWYPRFIDSIQTVNVDQVSAIKLNSLMLTQKENIVSVQFIAQYRIGDLQNYLFNVVNPVDTLSQSLDSSVRQVIGHSTLDKILTTGRAAIAINVRTQLEKLMARYKTGIQVVDVTMQPATAPDPVKAAFDDVIKAREDKVRLANEATGYANQVVPVAKGQAVRLTQQATAASAQAVNNAKAEVASFDAVLPQYKAAPIVTKERLYLETMENVLSHNQVVVADKSSHNMFYVPLDKMDHFKPLSVSHGQSIEAQSAKDNVPSSTKSTNVVSNANTNADSNLTSSNNNALARKLAYMRWQEAQ